MADDTKQKCPVSKLSMSCLKQLVEKRPINNEIQVNSKD